MLRSKPEQQAKYIQNKKEVYAFAAYSHPNCQLYITTDSYNNNNVEIINIVHTL